VGHAPRTENRKGSGTLAASSVSSSFIFPHSLPPFLHSPQEKAAKMNVRDASHAGSWYSSNSKSFLPSSWLVLFLFLFLLLTVFFPCSTLEKELDRQLTGWLAKVGSETAQGDPLPIAGLRAIIAP